jgi:hypothetical protein
LAALLGVLGLQPALAQDSAAVTVDVAHCTRLESADARRACFGAQVDAVLQERELTDGDERTAVAEDTEADPAASTRDEPSSPQRERRSKRDSSDDPRSVEAVEEARDDEYSGVIVAVRERLPNAYVITLDNGQIWQQTEPKQYPLRPGLEVRIYPTGWGSNYRLNGLGTGSHIQVRKVR